MNSEFSKLKTGRLTKVKETSLPYYLPIPGERTNRFMAFSKELKWSKIQTILSRIWTWVDDSISYDDNHYTEHASMKYTTTPLFIGSEIPYGKVSHPDFIIICCFTFVTWTMVTCSEFISQPPCLQKGLFSPHASFKWANNLQHHWAINLFE